MNWSPEIFSPAYWHKNAHNLSISAKVIEDKIYEMNHLPMNKIHDSDSYFNEIIAYSEAYMLIMGYSIENYLKGFALELYLRDHTQDEISDFNTLKKNVWKIQNGHDLPKLVRLFDINLTAPEDNLLIRYKNFIIWASKYHIPMDIKTFSENTYKGKFLIISHDKKILDRLLKKIKFSINNS